MSKIRKRPDRVGKWTEAGDILTREALKCRHSIDITDICPQRASSKRAVVIDYMQGTNGVHFRIEDCFSRCTYGEVVASPVELLCNIRHPLLGTFCRFAGLFGLKPEDLSAVIKEHAPALDRALLISDLRRAMAMPEIESMRFQAALRQAKLTISDLTAPTP
ncbi:MAG: hypothetical protein WCG97_02675 [bacterium]